MTMSHSTKGVVKKEAGESRSASLALHESGSLHLEHTMEGLVGIRLGEDLLLAVVLNQTKRYYGDHVWDRFA